MKKLSLLILLLTLVFVGCSRDDGVESYAISGTPVLNYVKVGYKRVVVEWEANVTSAEASSSNIYWSDGSNYDGHVITALDAEWIINESGSDNNTIYGDEIEL